MIDSNAIGLIFAGITSILVALGGLLSTRQKRTALDVDELRDQAEETQLRASLLQRQINAAIFHMGTLETALASSVEVPPRPPELAPGWVAEQMRAWSENKGDRRIRA